MVQRKMYMEIIRVANTFTTGVALAPAFVLMPTSINTKKEYVDEADKEIWKLETAIAVVSKWLTPFAAEEKIYEAHLAVVQDSSLKQQIIETIKNDCKCAEWALEEVIELYASKLDQHPNIYIRERANDIRDVGYQILQAMTNTDRASKAVPTSRSILVARNLSPSDIAKMNTSIIDGIILQEGSVTSHVSILAKNIGIPMLVNVPIHLESIATGTIIGINAEAGEIVLNPDYNTRKLYEQLQQKDQLSKKRTEYCKRPVSIKVFANVGTIEDIQVAFNEGADGIGLFRTEFLYMSHNHLPSEDEQYMIYAKAARLFGKNKVVIRTIDIGSDKIPNYIPPFLEENPALGCRGIRFSMSAANIFKTQIRALLRASAHGNICILYPMVTCLDELLWANTVVEMCKRELIDEGIDCNHDIPVGIMIETPAAIIMAEQLARYVDFFSLGTNDLTQFLLAADRNNSKLSYLYTPFQPAVMNALHQACEAAKNAHLSVCICGELASDPKALPYFLGLNVDELSVSVRSISQIKNWISSLQYKDYSSICMKILKCNSIQQIYDVLDTYH